MMEKQIVIFRGVSYDYCENIKFYSVLGFLDQENVLRGIEVGSDEYVDNKKLKKFLISKPNVRIICGTIRNSIVYYAIDMQEGKIVHTRLKPNGQDYTGSESTLCARFSMEKQDSKFKTASQIEKVEDLELEELLEQTLNISNSNTIWNEIQETTQTTPPKVKTLGL